MEYTAGALHGPAHTKAGWVSWSFPQYISNDPLSHPTNLKRTINIVGRDVHGDFCHVELFYLGHIEIQLNLLHLSFTVTRKEVKMLDSYS